MKIYSAAEFAKLDFGEPSEERLEKLPLEFRPPQRFREKADELRREAHIQTQLITEAEKMPQLAPDARHRYGYCFEDARQRLTKGEDLLIGVAVKEPRVIGFAIVARSKDGTSEFEILDVDTFSRRSSGLQTSLELRGENFTVGVAHILVNLILAELDSAIRANVTTLASRYVLKSLGYGRDTSNTNPCHLWRARGF